jgi:transposase-like protein
MDPAPTFCPDLACPARGRTDQGNIRIHSCKDKRFMGTECHKTFGVTTGTAFYCLRTAAETVSLVVTLMAHGCPLQAIVVAFGYDERTVACWLARAGVQGQAVQEHLVEQPRALGQVQADEIRVKKQGGIVWMALALMVKTRLWLAGEISEQRDITLIRRLIERVRACALQRCILTRRSERIRVTCDADVIDRYRVGPPRPERSMGRHVHSFESPNSCPEPWEPVSGKAGPVRSADVYHDVCCRDRCRESPTGYGSATHG